MPDVEPLTQEVVRLYPNHQWLPLIDSFGDTPVKHRDGSAATPD